MSAIGNYVHAYKKNYKEQSIGRHTKRTPPSIQAIYNSQKATIEQELYREFPNQKQTNAASKAQLEKLLNVFFHPGIRQNLNKGQLNEADIDAMKQAIEQYINTRIGKQVFIDFDTLAISTEINTAAINQDENLKKALDSINELNKFQVASSRNINKIKIMYRKFMRLRNALGSNWQHYVSSDFYNKLIDLQKQYANFIQTVSDYQKQTGNTTLIPRTYLGTNAAGKTIDEELNELLQSIKVTGKGQIVGLVGEAVLNATQYAINHKGRVNVNNLLAYLFEAPPGTSKSRKGVSAGAISWYASYYKNESTRFRNLSNGNKKEIFYGDLHLGNEFTTSITDDKVDLTITLPDFGDVNLSIKNYNLSDPRSSFKLLEGRNLLGLVQDYPVFVNHFLNIVGTHKDGNFPNDGNNIGKMHDIMKLTIFTKAIAGNVFTDKGYSNKVDILVVNDNSKGGGYKVYYLSDLLNKVSNHLDLLSVKDYPYGVWKENKWIKVGNDKNKPDIISAAIRITTLVNKMRDMKLVVSLKSAALTV